MNMSEKNMSDKDKGFRSKDQEQDQDSSNKDKDFRGKDQDQNQDLSD